jgi:hypothetical protein
LVQHLGILPKFFSSFSKTSNIFNIFKHKHNKFLFAIPLTIKIFFNNCKNSFFTNFYPQPIKVN